MYYNDLYRFDLSTLKWVILDRGSDVVTINDALGRPSPRDYLGFASTDTHLYVFGGWGGTGKQKRTLAPHPRILGKSDACPFSVDLYGYTGEGIALHSCSKKPTHRVQVEGLTVMSQEP